MLHNIWIIKNDFKNHMCVQWLSFILQVIFFVDSCWTFDEWYISQFSFCCILSQGRLMDHNEDEGMGITLLYIKKKNLFITLVEGRIFFSVTERDRNKETKTYGALEGIWHLDYAKLTLIFLAVLCQTHSFT